MNRPGASEEPIIGIGSDEILASEVRLATPSKVSPVTELPSCSSSRESLRKAWTQFARQFEYISKFAEDCLPVLSCRRLTVIIVYPAST